MSPTVETGRPTRRAGLVLVCGLLVIGTAAVTPAGLGGRPVPPFSVAIWVVVFLTALAVQRACGASPGLALKRLLLFAPFILLLVLPAALMAPPGRRWIAGFGLAARAVAATSGGIALAQGLGPPGLVAGLRQLRVPERLVHILGAALGSLHIVLRQVRAMLRAREARRPGYGAWSTLTLAPVRTARGFGRLVAALLLRSLERAEALDRARRARGAADA